MYIDGVGAGTDTSSPPTGGDSLLAGVRRLTLLADEATDSEAIFRALARELLHAPGAEEVHVHHLQPGASEELVTVYMFDGDGCLSYLLPVAERPQGVERVASTGRPLLVADPRELAAAVPRVALVTSPPTTAGCVLLLPLAERGEVEAVVMLVRRLATAFTDPSIELATTLVDQGATALALMSARAEAGTDPVTGCMNHRAMRRRLHEEIGRAARTGSPLSCLLIDLDDFKLVNDRHGHQAGDATLRGVVQALAGEFRAFDRVARYGGDEFVVILPNAALESAAAAAARALQRLLEMDQLGVSQAGVSASIGVAQWAESMSADALLEACDAALLRSKRQGKGRVTQASTMIR